MSLIILKKKFSLDILYYIQQFLIKSEKINKKWDLFFQRLFLKSKKYMLIDYFHNLHLYTRKISDLGRMYFNNQSFFEGEKMIRVSKNIHLCIEEYIKCVCDF